MRAKKSFGQHFLNSDDIARQIAEGLEQTATTRQVLEVGPGRGMLTQFLLENDYQTYAVEADRDMVATLQSKFPDWAKTYLIQGDFLDFNPKDIFRDEQFSLIGNFPYNISTQILFALLDHRLQIPEMVGMFQKEVADRVVAPPGSKTYGITSVLLQAYYEPTYLFTVEPESFNPPPKVRSAVIRLTRKDGFELDCDVHRFKSMVKTSFGQRRKMLRNTLKGFFEDRDLNDDPFFQKRPEQLGWEDFQRLANL